MTNFLVVTIVDDSFELFHCCEKKFVVAKVRNGIWQCLELNSLDSILTVITGERKLQMISTIAIFLLIIEKY